MDRTGTGTGRVFARARRTAAAASLIPSRARRLIRANYFLSALCVLCALSGGNVFAQNDPGAASLYYFKEARPLRLKPGRVALIHDRSAAPSRAAQTNATLASSVTGLTAHAVTGVYTGAISGAEDSASARSRIASLRNSRATVAGDSLRMISPVFADDFGGDLIITPTLVVAFTSGTSAADAEAVLNALPGARIVERDWTGMTGVYMVESSLGDGFALLDQAAGLAVRADVRYAEPDVIFTGRGDLVPNDPAYASNLIWGIHNIGQSGGVADMDMDGPEAWDTTIGSPAIKVVILDNGVQQDHPDINQDPGTDTTSDPSTDGGPVNSWDNHGTPVAGCISAIINNSIGTIGIAPGCKSVSARTFISINAMGNWTSQTSWSVASLAFAESIGARVTNNSNSYGTHSSMLADKYAQTRLAGIVHCASAGNDSSLEQGWPAVLPSVLSIAALNRQGNLASFSDSGPELALSAPGQTIYSTDRTGAAGYSASSYTNVNGTSFASPYTAGVAALVFSMNPAYSAPDVENILKMTAVDRGAPGYDETYGWGFVNANNAVLAAVSVTPVPTAVPPACPPFTDTLDPAPQPGWSHSATLGTDDWDLRESIYAQSPVNAFTFETALALPTDARLVTPEFEGGGTFRFWHAFLMEWEHDGGILEVSTDGGATWNDLGGYITQGGYSGRIDGGLDSPLAGRAAWTLIGAGPGGTLIETIVDMRHFTGPVRVGFRIGTDTGGDPPVWIIDDVSWTTACPTATPSPAPSASPTPTPPQPTVTPSPAATQTASPTPLPPTATPSSIPSHTASPTPAPPTATATPVCCPGDADNSGGSVNAADFLAVQSVFGTSAAPGGYGDADCSGGSVNAADFLAVQANFGLNCG